MPYLTYSNSCYLAVRCGAVITNRSTARASRRKPSHKQFGASQGVQEGLAPDAPAQPTAADDFLAKALGPPGRIINHDRLALKFVCFLKVRQ